MNLINHSRPSALNDESRSPSSLKGTTWTPTSSESTIPVRPITPLSFAFMPEEERAAIKFPKGEHDQEVNNNRSIIDDKKPGEEDYQNGVNVLSTFHNSVSYKRDSESSSSRSASTSESSPSVPRKTLKMSELMVVDDDNDSPSSPTSYEPKAHLGWASFGQSIKPPSPAKKNLAPVQLRRKVYIVRQNRDKPYQLSSLHNRSETLEAQVSSVPPKSKTPEIVSSKNVSSDSDEDVDVVGLDDDVIIPVIAKESPPHVSAKPPDLPPQPSFGSRFGFKNKRDSRLNYNSEEEDGISSRYTGGYSPPPQLEPQTSDSTSIMRSSDSNDEDKRSNEESSGSRMGIDDIDSSQVLKTKISSSTIPILPLSKSIMERKKVALEMTKNAVIKKLSVQKPTFKNFTVAPRSVQIPAYTESNAPMTLYSNMNKPVNFHKDARGRCVRCRDRSPVDMTTFKFVEDTTVVAVRAHLCDQTRVMIARTAIWNREYSKRLGDRATGTVWQKPDEVTAQMTGFCSATVRRCIDIANLSIVPRCADRIGVSKNELASLKTSFGNEKFFGQPMRTPHVLSQYYSIKAQAAGADQSTSSSSGPPPFPRLGRPPAKLAKNDMKDDEEEKRHHPLTYYQPSPAAQSAPQKSVSSDPPSVPPLKKTVLRWTSIQTPRILRTPTLKQAVPKMAVIPVIKKQPVAEKKEAKPSTGPKKRGRPKKVKPTEEETPPRRSYRSTKSRRKEMILNPVDGDVQETVKFLVNEVCNRVSNERS